MKHISFQDLYRCRCSGFQNLSGKNYRTGLEINPAWKHEKNGRILGMSFKFTQIMVARRIIRNIEEYTKSPIFLDVVY